jgi:hypothetical protein
MHRLSCLRDDLIFVCYLYQRWLYGVDKKRPNEFGQVEMDDDDAAAAPAQLAAAAPAEASPDGAAAPAAAATEPPAAADEAAPQGGSMGMVFMISLLVGLAALRLK